MALLKASPVQTLLFSVFFLQGLYISLGNFQIVFPNEQEYIIDSNDDITFTCKGDESVTWNYPKSTEDEEKWSSIYASLSQNGSTYIASLEIRNVSYRDVGFYSCLSPLTREKREFYLFVRDPVHLTATKDNIFITAMQGSEAVLPCRPTSPDVVVELVRSTGEKVDDIYEYDPKYGFTLIVTESPNELYDYVCSFIGGEVTTDISLYLDVKSLYTEPVDNPFLEDKNNNHTVVGGTLNLSCSVITSGPCNLNWTIPNPFARNEGRVIEKSTSKDSDKEKKMFLTIKNVTLEDRGTYTCTATDMHGSVNSTIFINVFDADEHHMKLYEGNGVYEISATVGNDSVQWVINVDAHPVPKLIWYNNRNQIIEGIEWIDKKVNKYNINTQQDRTILKINNITMSDRGYYELKASNIFEEKSLKLFLNVSGKPSLSFEKQDFYVINEPAPVKCSVFAFPKPDVFWVVKTCSDNTCSSQQMPSKEFEKSDYETISIITITPNNSGFIECSANNSLGANFLTSDFTVTDVPHGFSIWGLEDYVEDSGVTVGTVVVGETISLYCGASINHYTDQLFWYYSNFTPIENNDRISIEKSYTKYSYRVTLTIADVDFNDSGNYTCRGQIISDDLQNFKYAYVMLSVKEPKTPVITETNLSDDILEAMIPEKLDLFCQAEGIPKPKIVWLKNSNVFEDYLFQNRIQMFNNNQNISFAYTQVEDEGIYTCRAENRYGNVEESTSLEFKNKPKFNYLYMVAVAAVLIILLTALIWIIIKQQKQKKLLEELKSAGLMNFEKGALENLNPELGIDDQAELLPYDTKFEFPRDKLKLGKQLGAGAFGVVLKAEAKGIIEGEDVTTVAVKMVKRNADASYIKALASELKILVHLGNHLNVVNLLGACTKNAAKTRELLVIVEYCRFGNIHNFLIRHRQIFINQIDPKTKQIDFSIGADTLERTFSVSSNRSDATSTSGDAMSYKTSRTGSTIVCMSPTGDPDDVFITNSNSSQPEWRSNYRGDYKGNVKPIATKDLISWAFQVARGMEYLASRKVLHGDLAARNVLLAENNVVKICDFGLAKSIYKNNNYQKKGDGPLPVKWMAIESIRDRIFSTQSDVWSFGIVLWEFFSLARTPYPGMEADERLYFKLMDGYRMDTPEYATKNIYQLMLDCWHPNPVERPTFTSLADTIGLMLEEGVRQHYIDLNDPYLKMNTQRLESQEDYLAMLSPPDFNNLCSPNTYVNEPTIADKGDVISDTPGYLCMKPNNTFSPPPQEIPIFVFDANRKPKDEENDGGVELVPMLGGTTESDCESHPGSPSFPNSFYNPTYHLPPVVTSSKEDVQILHSDNNYVNMPQNKNAILRSTSGGLKEKDGCVNSANEHNYVNSNSRDWGRVEL